MGRRRQRIGLSFERTQDPGKDLFAYLFLLMMVFSFMLLMTAGVRQGTFSGQTGPQQHDDSGRSRLASVSTEKIARLGKKDDRLCLRFGNESYDPARDLDRLLKDDRVALIMGTDGQQQRVLYLEEDKTNKVLLAEYLEAFQYMNRRGIGVAFAERIK